MSAVTSAAFGSLTAFEPATAPNASACCWWCMAKSSPTGLVAGDQRRRRHAVGRDRRELDRLREGREVFVGERLRAGERHEAARREHRSDGDDRATGAGSLRKRRRPCVRAGCGGPRGPLPGTSPWLRDAVRRRHAPCGEVSLLRSPRSFLLCGAADVVLGWGLRWTGRARPRALAALARRCARYVAGVTRR